MSEQNEDLFVTKSSRFHYTANRIGLEYEIPDLPEEAYEDLKKYGVSKGDGVVILRVEEAWDSDLGSIVLPMTEVAARQLIAALTKCLDEKVSIDATEG